MMPRKRKDYRQGTAPRPVDDLLLDDLAAAADVKMDHDQRDIIAAQIRAFNSLPSEIAEYRRIQNVSRGRGRPRSVNRDALICGVLAELGRAGMVVKVGRPDDGRPAQGRAANVLRIVWDALAAPELSRDGFARKAAEAYRDPIARRKLAKLEYLDRLTSAWKS